MTNKDKMTNKDNEPISVRAHVPRLRESDQVPGGAEGDILTEEKLDELRGLLDAAGEPLTATMVVDDDSHFEGTVRVGGVAADDLPRAEQLAIAKLMLFLANDARELERLARLGLKAKAFLGERESALDNGLRFMLSELEGTGRRVVAGTEAALRALRELLAAARALDGGE